MPDTSRPTPHPIAASASEPIRLKSFRIEFVRAEPDTPPTPTTGADGTSQVDRFPYVLTASREFRDAMCHLWRYTARVGKSAELAGMVNVGELISLLAKLRQDSAASPAKPLARFRIHFALDDSPAPELTREFPVVGGRRLRQCADLLDSSHAAIRLLHQTTIQQIVVLLERLMAEIVFHGVMADSQNTFTDRALKVPDLLELKDFDELKSKVAYEETEEFLRSSTERQLTFFAETFRVKLSDLIPTTNALLEVVLRRHTIVHGTSFSGREYWRRRRAIPGLPKIPEEGDPTNPSAKYLSEAWETVFSAGVVLTHATMARIAGFAKTEQHRDMRRQEADTFLITASFEAIRLRMFAASERILKYFIDKATSERKLTEHRLMAIINLAQSHKWNGNESDCKKALAAISRGTTSAKFALCIAALRDQVDEFRNLLKSVAADGSLNVEDLLTWPVFRAMRLRVEFRSWVADSFGVSVEALPQVPQPQVLVGDERESLRELEEVLRGLVDAGPNVEAVATADAQAIEPKSASEGRTDRGSTGSTL